MAAVALVTVQKELFKNVAEILLEAQAAGNLISKRLSGEKEEEGEETSHQFPGCGWDIAGSGRNRGNIWGCVLLQAALGSSLLSLQRTVPLQCLDLEREKLRGGAE